MDEPAHACQSRGDIYSPLPWPLAPTAIYRLRTKKLRRTSAPRLRTIRVRLWRSFGEELAGEGSLAPNSGQEPRVKTAIGGRQAQGSAAHPAQSTRATATMARRCSPAGFAASRRGARRREAGRRRRARRREPGARGAGGQAEEGAGRRHKTGRAGRREGGERAQEQRELEQDWGKRRVQARTASGGRPGTVIFDIPDKQQNIDGMYWQQVGKPGNPVARHHHHNPDYTMGVSSVAINNAN